MTQPVPKKTIYRLSIYSRALHELLAAGTEMVSSETLAGAAGVSPAQVRKDLTHFGHFGRPGLGYNVRELQGSITAVLGTNRLQPVILIGAGHLGCALLAYDGFAREGYEIVAAFDVEPDRPRSPNVKVPILAMRDLRAFVRKHRIRMGILCVPALAAQATVNDIIAAGVEAILNFAPTTLSAPPSVMISSVNLAAELDHLSYFLKPRNTAES